MRLAILSDIHGNSVALDAVLTDIEAQGGCDQYWIVGDIVALGHDPVGVMERLSRLSQLRMTRGNTDRYTLSGELPPAALPDNADPGAILAWRLIESRTFGWTHGALAAGGWLDLIAELPLEERWSLPDGTRLLAVHASPGRDDGAGLSVDHNDADLMGRFGVAEADVIVVGHTHQTVDRVVGNQRLFNLGCVSLQQGGERRASYALLEATQAAHSLQHRFVDYDRVAVINAIDRVRHPSAEWLIAKLGGRSEQPVSRE